MFKKIFISFILACSFQLSALSSLAEGEFNTSYNITYEILESGQTRVTQDIVLTNNLDNVYATSFVVKTGFTRISGVESFDRNGQQQVGVTQNDNETTIKVNFNGQTVGIGNQFNFTLKYDTKDVAQKTGKIWEINIPKLGSGNFVDQYNVRLVIPKSFGNPSFISPKPIRELIFNKEQLLSSGITAIFGEYQLYNFNLKYHLKNDKPTPIITEIALPPDTPYQKVFISAIDPAPQNVLVDKDNNWLAQYKLNGNEILNIAVSGQAKTFMSPQSKVTITDEQRKEYTSPKKYWESDNPDILKRAQQLKTPKAIYEFVESTLSYNYKKVGSEINRLGGAEALKEPNNSVCTEFTDLFISLARAAGIPARELNGFANTENSILRPLSLEKDILHAWPEYYDDDKQTWIQIDPTWGNTTKGVDYFNKLDFNHFAFVVKGIESNYPYPAGSYKYDDNNEKDVEVTPSDEENIEKTKELNVVFNIPKKIIAGIETKGSITIYNPNSVNFPNLLPNIEGDPIDTTTLNNNPITIPPFAKAEIPFKINRTSFFNHQKETIILKINDQKNTTVIDIEPLLPLKFWPVTLIITLLIFYVIFVKNKTKKSSKNSRSISL